MAHDSLVAHETVAGCYSCEHNAQPALSPHERIYDDGLWRVSHSFNSTWLGWLVLVFCVTRREPTAADQGQTPSPTIGRAVWRDSATGASGIQTQAECR